MKAPIFPFHTWSPDAYAEAPVAGSVDAGRRHWPSSAPTASSGSTWTCSRRPVVDLAPVLLTLGASASSTARSWPRRQQDLKRLVAYSSLAHIGFIVLGTFALTDQALTGSVIQMVNHGWSSRRLSSSLISYDLQAPPDLAGARLGGLQRPAPVLAARRSRWSCWPRSACRASTVSSASSSILAGHVRHPPLVGGGGHGRGGPGRHLPAVGLPAGLPRHEPDPATASHPGHHLARGRRGGPAGGPHRASSASTRSRCSTGSRRR